MTGQVTVGVVVPVYNGQTTLDETLHSVRAQTHRALSIVVVDDGSTDDTARIAARHAAADPRVQVLHQPNAGVAAARNTGWQHVAAPFYSFIDADDLWAPTKIERQLTVLQKAGSRAGLAYARTATIGRDGRITNLIRGELHQGEVLSKIMHSNFIASGSNVLVRREALVETGGFDAGLRAAGAQGCEDWLFSCRVAERWHYAGVPAYLIGYRQLDDSMSSDRPQMLRSHMLMCRQLLERHPGLRDPLLGGLQSHCAWQLRAMRWHRAPRQAWQTWRQLLRDYPETAWRVIWRELAPEPLRTLRNLLSRRGASDSPDAAAQGQRFLDVAWP